MHLSLYSNDSTSHRGVQFFLKTVIPQYINSTQVIKDTFETLCSHCPPGRGKLMSKGITSR